MQLVAASCWIGGQQRLEEVSLIVAKLEGAGCLHNSVVIRGSFKVLTCLVLSAGHTDTANTALGQLCNVYINDKTTVTETGL